MEFFGWTGKHNMARAMRLHAGIATRQFTLSLHGRGVHTPFPRSPALSRTAWCSVF